MTVQHANINVNNIHECKGTSVASNHTVRIADGAGSGSWALVPPSSLTGINNVNKIVLTKYIADLNAAASYFMVSPLAGSVTKCYSVIDSALASADNLITLKIATVAVTNGVITITQSGSAAGDVDVCTPTAANALTAGQAIEIVSNGGTSSTTSCTLTFIIDVA